MRNNFCRKLFAVLLVFVLVLAAVPLEAQAVSQAEINQMAAERDRLAAQREEQQKIVDELEEQHATVLELKLAMDQRNDYTIRQMELNSEEIALYDRMIAEKAEEVEEAKRLEAQQLERYRARIRAMEENGNIGILGLLFSTDNVGEFLTAMDDVGEIMESDKRLEKEYIAARENTERVLAEYEQTKLELEARQEELRAEQAELEKEIEEATQLILELENDLAAQRAEYEAMMQDEDEANRRVEAMVAELERQRQEAMQQQQQQGSTGNHLGAGNAVGTGSFTWPCPSSTYITSRFGLRTHPVYGTQRSHTGMDIAANSGANVLAADGGTVTLAGVNGGYGNCIMIDHGNGYQTLYGHMSALYVYEGQVVNQGDVIAAVGSTGVSTGPHLHFEVWSGGGRIDPERFFSGLTFSEGAGV